MLHWPLPSCGMLGHLYSPPVDTSTFFTWPKVSTASSEEPSVPGGTSYTLGHHCFPNYSLLGPKEASIPKLQKAVYTVGNEPHLHYKVIKASISQELVTGFICLKDSFPLPLAEGTYGFLTCTKGCISRPTLAPGSLSIICYRVPRPHQHHSPSPFPRLHFFLIPFVLFISELSLLLPSWSPNSL